MSIRSMILQVKGSLLFLSAWFKPKVCSMYVHCCAEPVELQLCCNNLQTVASVGSRQINSKCIEGSFHYLGDKQDFDVSSKGPSSLLIPDDRPLLKTSKSCLSPRQ